MRITGSLLSEAARRCLLAVVIAAAGGAWAKEVEVVAVYYPHWHRYPKGDEWFGADKWKQGEWAFVKKPVTRFPGHINFKPYAGYLDGSDPADVSVEIGLAANAGIDVFLYDYYWYNGEKTQEEAIEKGFLQAKNRDRMKFALMWCYHERNDQFRPKFGEKRRQLMTLAHTPEEFLGLIDYSIAHYFGRPEYWRKDGKVFFSIYNAPYLWETWGRDAAKVKAAFAEARRRVVAAGLGGLHLNGQNVSPQAFAKMGDLGFDSYTDYGYNAFAGNRYQRYMKGERLFDYSEVDGTLQAQWAQRSRDLPAPYFPIVPTGWDSTLRCRADEPFPWKGERPEYPYCGTFTNFTDTVFEKLLRDAKAHVLADPRKPGVVYVNAWNEYTEGCYLLPDCRRVDLKLRALARVFGRHPADKLAFTINYPYYLGDNQPHATLRTIRAPDVENAKYGPHQRQGMDVWLPPNRSEDVLSPVLVAIHGGGWNGGDRLKIAESWIDLCAKRGIVLVAANYRLIQDAHDEQVSPPVKAPLDDAVALVDFVKVHAAEWRIDVKRIALTGGSAGACSSLYAALQDDCALGVKAVFAVVPQTSLDPEETRGWIPNARYGSHAFGYRNFNDWLAHRADCLHLIERYSPAALLRKCTPAKAPVFRYSCGPEDPPGTLPKDPTHAAAFCLRFEELCRARGIRCERSEREKLLDELAR